MFYQDTKKNYVVRFVLSLLLCLGGGWLTGLLTQHGVKDWYPYLIKSKGTPPDIIFPIVWTILYILMAVSLTLLLINQGKQKRSAFVCFGIQLFLNFIWSWLFFYLQLPGVALLDILILWVAIWLCILFFWRHTHLGSYLLWPYLVWVTYAGYLNFFIWIHN